jgi:hypothetical protein
MLMAVVIMKIKMMTTTMMKCDTSVKGTPCYNNNTDMTNQTQQ